MSIARRKKLNQQQKNSVQPSCNNLATRQRSSLDDSGHVFCELVACHDLKEFEDELRMSASEELDLAMPLKPHNPQLEVRSANLFFSRSDSLDANTRACWLHPQRLLINFFVSYLVILDVILILKFISRIDSHLKTVSASSFGDKTNNFQLGRSLANRFFSTHGKKPTLSEDWKAETSRDKLSLCCP